MNLHHRLFLRRRFRGVDLNFVVILGANRHSERETIDCEKEQALPEMFRHDLHQIPILVQLVRHYTQPSGHNNEHGDSAPGTRPII
jgi:hypothetical protein